MWEKALLDDDNPHSPESYRHHLPFFLVGFLNLVSLVKDYSLKSWEGKNVYAHVDVSGLLQPSEYVKGNYYCIPFP